MKSLRKTLFAVVMLVGLCGVGMAQKDDPKKAPPKEKPPTVDPRPKNPPPTPRPKKPDTASVLITMPRNSFFA